ncbi:TPA: hypothetical protein QDZ12_006177 [Pseudomonas putida]|nr:hypothetical protein [Pseudomonas putida]
MVTEKRRGPTRKRSMTSAEFDAVLPFLRGISDERKKAARLALVDGMTLEGVGNIFGWTRQSVNTCVRVVWREFEAYQESLNARQSEHLPDGWERVTLVAPADLIPGFYAQIAEATARKKTGE